MKSRCLLTLMVIITVSPLLADAAPQPRRPQLDKLEQVVRPERLVRSSGLTFIGMEIWCVVYQGQGRYAVLDQKTNSWRFGADEKHRRKIGNVSGGRGSPGGICSANGNLWITSSTGDSIGCIKMADWSVVHHFRQVHRADKASQSYSAVAHDGKNLWIAWHWFNYDLPAEKTQLLLKMDATTGKVISEYPIPAGKQRDGTHGLAWDGTSLWHIKDQTLSSIDASNGKVIAQFKLQDLERPSGLTWDGTSLWITEFNGALWRLPLESTPNKDNE